MGNEAERAPDEVTEPAAATPVRVASARDALLTKAMLTAIHPSDEASPNAGADAGTPPEGRTASRAAPSEPVFLTVARVLRPHGTRGEVACEIITEFPQR